MSKTKYYHFHVENGYCGCDNDIYGYSERDLNDIQLAAILDSYSHYNAVEYIDNCLDADEREDEEFVREYYEEALSLGSYEQIDTKETWKIISLGYDLDCLD